MHFKLQLHDDYTEKDDHYEHKPEDYIDHHHGHQSDAHSEEISVKFYCLVSETDSNKKVWQTLSTRKKISSYDQDY